jgi:hypothetical protein
MREIYKFEDEGHLIIRNVPKEEKILSGREERRARRKAERKSR